VEGPQPTIAGEGAQRGLPPLVGREQELALIERHLSGDGPAVLVFAGEPGIGKSRLLREAALRAQEQGWRVLQGGCHRRSGQEPYAPFLGLLERHLASLSPAERRVVLKGCGWLARLLPELAEEVAEVTPAWTLPPEQERRLMFGAVARYLANVAGGMGILLVLDDLQWAGADALDLLNFIIHSPAPLPLRVVAAYRDIEVRSQDALAVLLTDLAREGHVLRSVLYPLPTSEAAALLDDLLGGIPGDQASLRQQVLQRAGGLPFFLVSCAQVLRDDAFKGDPKHLGGEKLPWSVKESIRQRVAALPELAQETLGVAAVIGRASPRALLVRIAGTTARREEELLAALESACQARLLMEEGETAYAFAHDLVREVIGNDLSAARRAKLHRQVAQALEQGPGEAPVEALAYHYSLAGEHEQAIKYLERAGEHALAIYANAEAERYYRDVVRGLEETGQMVQAAQARERLGTALTILTRYDEAIDVLEQAIEVFRRENQHEQWLQALAHMGWVQALRGTSAEALERLEPLLESLSADSPSSGLAALYVSVSYLYLAIGQHARQLATAERGIEIARAAGDQRMLMMAYDRRATALMMWDRLEESRQALVEQVIPQAEALGDFQTLVRAWLNLSQVYGMWGLVDQERPAIEQTLILAERLGDSAMDSFAHFRLGEFFFETGAWKQARQKFEQALALIRPVGMSRYAGFPPLGLGVLCQAEGRQEAANDYLDEAVKLAQATQSSQIEEAVQAALAERELLNGQPEAARPRLKPWSSEAGRMNLSAEQILPLLAWIYVEQGEESQAQELLQQLIEHRRAAQERRHLAEALQVQARLEIRRSRWQEAEEVLEEALALCRATGSPYAEAKTLYIYGLLHLKQGESALAHQRLEEALAIMNRLGERLYAQRVEQALGALPDTESRPP
jgi:tetratricopeptide (TPR) repeat protein